MTNHVTITKAPADNEYGIDFIINGLYTADSQVGAVVDYANNRLYILPGYGVGTYDNGKVSGVIITISASQAKSIECKINKDGSITTSDLALAVYVEGQGVVGTLDLLKKPSLSRLHQLPKPRATVQPESKN